MGKIIVACFLLTHNVDDLVILGNE